MGQTDAGTLPKVLHQVAVRKLLVHVIEAASALEPERMVVFVDHGRNQVSAPVQEFA